MNIPFHPAPGLGEMLPGFFVVPQNPIKAAGGMGGIRYQPHVGELMPASFTVPQNPIVKNIRTGMGGLATGRFMGFTGGMSGLGEFDLSSITENFKPGEWSTQTWLMIAGAGILLIMMARPGQSQYKAAMSQARADYQKSVAGIRSKYKRVGQRVGKGAARFARRLAAEE